ncbi:MAG TPA: MoxR family ATPase [Exilispira sp.]|nr:MoxR family ATPase [Exilispira sp.]
MEFKRIYEAKEQILSELSKAIVGKKEIIEMLLATFLAGGHVLFEDYPGLGKTLIARSLASVLGLEFKRIQFTPDLLPQDITGTFVYDKDKKEFIFRAGPIFTQILLADEINRASARTQSALLEAMQENQVTVEGQTMHLKKPFLVIATQNPIEYEGTFPLPEAELDRFAVKLSVNYPTIEEEQRILQLRKERRQDEVNLSKVLNEDEFLSMQKAIEDVYVDESIEKYIVSIIFATRQDSNINVGASPRGSLMLYKIARAYAAICGRDYVIPDDIKKFINPVLSHRIMLDPSLWLKKNAAIDVLERITRTVPVPIGK